MQIDDRFRERIASIRKERNLSQVALSDMVGRSESFIKDIESGKTRDPGFHAMVSIAEALNCTLMDIVPNLPPVTLGLPADATLLDKELLADAVTWILSRAAQMNNPPTPDQTARAVLGFYHETHEQTQSGVDLAYRAIAEVVSFDNRRGRSPSETQQPHQAATK